MATIQELIAEGEQIVKQRHAQKVVAERAAADAAQAEWETIRAAAVKELGEELAAQVPLVPSRPWAATSKIAEVTVTPFGRPGPSFACRFVKDADGWRLATLADGHSKFRVNVKYHLRQHHPGQFQIDSDDAVAVETIAEAVYLCQNQQQNLADALREKQRLEDEHKANEIKKQQLDAELTAASQARG